MCAVAIVASLAFASHTLAYPEVQMGRVMGKAFMPAVATPQRLGHLSVPPEPPVALADLVPIANLPMSNPATSIAHLRKEHFKLEETNDRMKAELESLLPRMPQAQATLQNAQTWTNIIVGFGCLGSGMVTAFFFFIIYPCFVKGNARAPVIYEHPLDGAILHSSTAAALPLLRSRGALRTAGVVMGESRRPGEAIRDPETTEAGYRRSGDMNMSMASGRVAVVTGASRGIGRGIAIELGRQGHTVYALGRSTRGQQTTERMVAKDLDLTIESTAEAITAAGGTGHGIACDLSKDADIESALAQVVAAEGKIDILVCSAYTTPPGTLRADFWTQGVEMWDACNGVGLRGVYKTCSDAVPLMLGSSGSSPPPLIVLVSSFGGKAYTFNVAYGVGKAAIDRLASDMSFQLRQHGIATVSIYPGVVKTEANLEMDRQGTWAEASGGLDLTQGETPQLSGKAVCALASLSAEEMLAKYSGKVCVVAELAEELGFAEDDGSVPPSIRSLRYLAPNFIFPQIESESGKPVPDWLKRAVPDWKLPWSVFAGGPPPEPAPRETSTDRVGGT